MHIPVVTTSNLRQLASVARYHHEWWNGQGYPEGLEGEHIPLEARIISLCDAVESMTSERPYQKAKSLTAIIRKVQRCAGSQFDPKIAELFVRLIQQDSGLIRTVG